MVSKKSTYAFLVPLKQPLDSIFDLNSMSPAYGVEFTYVYEFAHGAIRLRWIKKVSTLSSPQAASSATMIACG